LGVEECRLYLLSQSAHEKDFYDTASGKLQRYVHCANVVRGDRTVPKQIFMGGVHIPTILVANHRNPDPRLNGGTSILPHFYILPFYDTNIGNIMKHTSAMNIVQSYEMQSILRPGEVFVDVGANLGSYTLALAEHVGPNGIVIAFEPFRWLFQILNANIAANGLMNCWTYQIGLGEIASRESLLQPNLRFFSSPGGVRVESQLKNMSLETQKQMYDHEWGLESVDIWRLDDIVFEGSMFRSARAPQVDLIKIDVEGMEVPVIKGALKTLDQLKPVVWVESVGYFESGDLTLVNLLDSAGYVCWKSLSAGNDLICEPKDGSRSDRLNRVRKQPLGESSPQVCSL
jgi:FkbM family methyltransferase